MHLCSYNATPCQACTQSKTAREDASQGIQCHQGSPADSSAAWCLVAETVQKHVPCRLDPPSVSTSTLNSTSSWPLLKRTSSPFITSYGIRL